jgi:hypothetical protein
MAGKDGQAPAPPSPACPRPPRAESCPPFWRTRTLQRRRLAMRRLQSRLVLSRGGRCALHRLGQLVSLAALEDALELAQARSLLPRRRQQRCSLTACVFECRRAGSAARGWRPGLPKQPPQI